jgi:hypothetical protein
LQPGLPATLDIHHQLLILGPVVHAIEVAAAIYLYHCFAGYMIEINTSVPKWQVDLAGSTAVYARLHNCLHGIYFTLWHHTLLCSLPPISIMLTKLATQIIWLPDTLQCAVPDVLLVAPALQCKPVPFQSVAEP